MNTLQIQRVLITVIVFIVCSKEPARAGVGGSPTNGSETPNAPASTQSSDLSNGSSNTSSPYINQQADYIQNNNTGTSSLSQPVCRGACVFAVGRMNGRSAEGMAGVIWQISSPDNTYAKTERLRIQTLADHVAQEDTLTLQKELERAILSGKQETIMLYAIPLAKRWGYPSAERLLQEMKVKISSP